MLFQLAELLLTKLCPRSIFIGFFVWLGLPFFNKMQTVNIEDVYAVLA